MYAQFKISLGSRPYNGLAERGLASSKFDPRCSLTLDAPLGLKVPPFDSPHQRLSWAGVTISCLCQHREMQ